MANRKDPRGRTLKSGEVYRKDGRYVYTYTNHWDSENTFMLMTLYLLGERNKNY